MYERDCSVHRRYQKVIEAGPGPTVSDELRKGLSEAAITATKSIHYVGAGTVEFVVDSADKFYFFNASEYVDTFPFYF